MNNACERSSRLLFPAPPRRAQVLGTHNSYHQAPEESVLHLYSSGGGPTPLWAWAFSHPPLPEQLDRGVRSLELDVNWDPQGGAFAQAAALKLLGQTGWLDGDPALKAPGFKARCRARRAPRALPGRARRACQWMR